MNVASNVSETSLLPVSRFARLFQARPQLWLGLPWLLIFALITGWEFYSGFIYKSNDTTNIFLRLARASAWALLPTLALLWLPVMRNSISALQSSWLCRVLPLDGARNLHRWLGHLILALSLLHASQYLSYYITLNQPFTKVLFGSEPDLVRASKTSMFDFVTDPKDIDRLSNWIKAGTPYDLYEAEVKPFMEKDCTKCHNTTSTRTYARTDMPLTTYDDVVSWTRSSWLSRQFRINISGIIMLFLFTAVWVTSLAWMRHRSYNVFQTVHRVGYGLAVLALLHIPALQWIVGPAVVLALELYLSRHRRLYRACPARLSKVNDEIVRLDIERPKRLRLPPGHYVQLRIPGLGHDEWHAFSLAGPDEEDSPLIIKIRCFGDWTEELMQMVSDKAEIELHIDIRGPYSSPAAEAVKHRDWLLIAGGIGVTPFLSLIWHLITSPPRTRDVHFVWIMRHPDLLQWIEPCIDRLAQLKGLRMHWYLYIDTPDHFDQLPILKGKDGPEWAVQAGRPDWDTLFRDIGSISKRPACFVCGPDGLMKVVKQTCRRHGWSVRSESF